MLAFLPSFSFIYFNLHHYHLFCLPLVSRKRKAKNWEDEDFYDSDDDTFLDRTGLVEKKRLNRMKKAGKIDEKPETFESLASFIYRNNYGSFL